MNRDRLKVARPMAKLREGRDDWYKIRNQADGSAEVMVYDEIGYWGVTAQDFVADLQGLDAEQITLRINSPGGEVFDGIAIYNALKQHKAKVRCVVEGLAASIASVIAMAGDEVVMAKNATLMIHDGHALCVGNAADMQQTAELLDKTSDNIASIYAERAGGDIATWRDHMRAETWYSADEAVEAGLADEVQGAASAPAPATNSWDLSIFNYSGRDNAPQPESAPERAPEFDWNPEIFRQAIEEAAQ